MVFCCYYLTNVFYFCYIFTLLFIFDSLQKIWSKILPKDFQLDWRMIVVWFAFLFRPFSVVFQKFNFFLQLGLWTWIWYYTYIHSHKLLGCLLCVWPSITTKGVGFEFSCLLYKAMLSGEVGRACEKKLDNFLN